MMVLEDISALCVRTAEETFYAGPLIRIIRIVELT
jgi:hypothetical protein